MNILSEPGHTGNRDICTETKMRDIIDSGFIRHLVSSEVDLVDLREDLEGGPGEAGE